MTEDCRYQNMALHESECSACALGSITTPRRYLWTNFKHGSPFDTKLSSNSGPHPDWTVERIYSRDEMLNAIERIEWLVLHLRHHHGCIHTEPEFGGIMKWVKEIKV